MSNPVFRRLVEQELKLTVVEEYKFHHKRKFLFDYAIVDHKIAIEQEGGVFNGGAHGSVTGILRDIEKYNLATVNGWRVLRVLPNNLISGNTLQMIKDIIKNDSK